MNEIGDPSPQPNEVKSPRENSTVLLISILLLVVLVIALLVYQLSPIKELVSPFTNNQQNQIPDSTTINQQLDIKQDDLTVGNDNSTLGVYYYTVDDSSEQNTQYKLFKVSTDFEEQDLLTHTFTIAGRYPQIITDSWKTNTILFVLNTETQAVIYSLDVTSQNSQPQALMTIPLESGKGRRIGAVRFIDNGTSIAYITSDGEGVLAENSVLNITPLEDPSSTETYPLSKISPLYAGFNFLAATPDSKTIYLHETGGDAGLIWSQWYKIERATKAVQELAELPPVAKGDENPTISVFSPDRTKLAYVDFSSVIEPEDLDFEGYDQYGYLSPCLKSWDSNAMQKYESDGGVIMILDLHTRNTREFFRNLSYSDNLCKIVARRIISLAWLDVSHLIFQTIDGVYMLDVTSNQQRTLFTFEKTFSPGQQTRPSILSVQLPFIIFTDRSIINVNSSKRLEFLAPEAQEGRFFVVE